jgi:isocitrate dehydrogenase (NAD+)
MRANGQKKVAAIHKANIMKLTDGLFLQCARNVAVKYPKIGWRSDRDNASFATIGTQSRDSMCCCWRILRRHRVLWRRAWSVVWSGGGANPGDTHALFEPVHGSAPDIKGKKSPTDGDDSRRSNDARSHRRRARRETHFDALKRCR